MIVGTPAMMMTLPIQKPGAAETLLVDKFGAVRHAGHAHARLVHFRAERSKRAFITAIACGS